MQYEKHRNLLSTLLKKSKKSNWNNVIITWKGIKSIIKKHHKKTLKNITSSVPRTIWQGEHLITNPYDIANIFDNYFSSVADTAKVNIEYSHKHFSNYLNNK